jgi:hypothetical protein
MTESPGSVFLDYSPSGVKIEVPGKLPSGKEIWKVEISGSFTSWRPGPSMRAEDGRFVLTLPSKKFAVPGNSGYPELTFLVNGRYWFGYDFLWEAPSLLFDRLVVLVPPEELPGWLGQKEKCSLSDPVGSIQAEQFWRGKAVKIVGHSWAMGLPASRFYSQKCRN